MSLQTAETWEQLVRCMERTRNNSSGIRLCKRSPFQTSVLLGVFILERVALIVCCPPPFYFTIHALLGLRPQRRPANLFPLPQRGLPRASRDRCPTNQCCRSPTRTRRILGPRRSLPRSRLPPRCSCRCGSSCARPFCRCAHRGPRLLVSYVPRGMWGTLTSTDLLRATTCLLLSAPTR